MSVVSSYIASVVSSYIASYCSCVYFQIMVIVHLCPVLCVSAGAGLDSSFLRMHTNYQDCTIMAKIIANDKQITQVQVIYLSRYIDGLFQ